VDDRLRACAQGGAPRATQLPGERGRERADGSLDKWLAAHPQLGRRVVIPAELKWEVRDKLDQANITDRVLFPGLDGLSRWVTRYYGPRRP
jgi:hypothetical protein